MNNSETLKRHNETDHKKSNSFICQECDLNFPQNKALENHTRRAHGSKFGCQPCDQTFLDEEKLISHMNEHHEKNLLENTFFNPSASY